MSELRVQWLSLMFIKERNCYLDKAVIDDLAKQGIKASFSKDESYLELEAGDEVSMQALEQLINAGYISCDITKTKILSIDLDYFAPEKIVKNDVDELGERSAASAKRSASDLNDTGTVLVESLSKKPKKEEKEDKKEKEQDQTQTEISKILSTSITQLLNSSSSIYGGEKPTRRGARTMNPNNIAGAPSQVAQPTQQLENPVAQFNK